MPLIKIEELDLTSAGNRSQENDVIYIPGLVDINQSDLYVEGEYIGLKPFEPTYIENLSAFKTLVGDRGVVFEEDQLYTDLIEEIDGEYFGFDENAIPYSKVMLRKGQVDPSYVMAKELLAAGLPIVYERINNDPVLEKVNSEPAGWGVVDQSGYGIHQEYHQNKTGYKHIQSTTPPKLFVKYTTYDETIGSVDLYERILGDDGTYTYSKVATATSELIVPEGKTYYYETGIKVYKPESVALKFEENKYYTADGDILSEEPNDWGTGTYYTKEISYDEIDIYTEIVTTINKVEIIDDTIPEFKEGTYYHLTDLGGYELIDTIYKNTPEDEQETFWNNNVENYFTVSPKFEQNKYYFKSEEEDKYTLLESHPSDWPKPNDSYYEVTPFESNKYYASIDDKDPIAEKPEDWDPTTTIYYTQKIEYKEINYIDVMNIKADKPIYTFREDLDLYVEIEKNEDGKYKLKDKIENENEYEYFYEYSDLFTFTTYPNKLTAKDEYEVRKDFINKFSEYCEKKSSLESLEDVTVAPPFKDIYINNTYLDIKSIYDSLSEVFSLDRDNGLTDMGNINIKYITSGGYPTYEYRGNEIATKMIKIAKTRGDAIAFIDHTNNSDRTTNMSQPSSLYAVVKNDSSIQADGEFGTMFTPYMNFVRTTKDDTAVGQSYNPQIEMSGTYAYLMCLANSIKVNPAWLAVAGAARGVVPNLQQVATNTPISNGNADKMQLRDNVSVNAITEIKPYGYTIWGNRTLKNNGTEGNLKATSFLNIRNLVCDIKKVAYSTARALTFEQNNDILWINFQSKLTPTLDKMKSGYGISGYKIVRNTEHEKANEKATLCANIIIYPTYAVEDFYITVVLTDDEVGVEE